MGGSYLCCCAVSECKLAFFKSPVSMLWILLRSVYLSLISLIKSNGINSIWFKITMCSSPVCIMRLWPCLAAAVSERHESTVVWVIILLWSVIHHLPANLDERVGALGSMRAQERTYTCHLTLWTGLKGGRFQLRLAVPHCHLSAGQWTRKSTRGTPHKGDVTHHGSYPHLPERTWRWYHWGGSTGATPPPCWFTCDLHWCTSF